MSHTDTSPAPSLPAHANVRPLPPARVRVRPQPSSPADTEPDDGPGAGASRDYEVGYGRPPKASRFQPGQSGNPKGRPKGAKGLNTIVRESLTQKVTVRTAHGEKRISRIEAVLHKTIELAMKGNPRAQGELMRRYGEAVPDEKTTSGDDHQADSDLTTADHAILEAFYEELTSSRSTGHDA